jgi:kumamolisin
MWTQKSRVEVTVTLRGPELPEPDTTKPAISRGDFEGRYGASSEDIAKVEEALMGITVCVAAGDDGSGDQLGDGHAHVNFPASSPNVLSVGGTMLQGLDEVVWWQPPGRRTPAGGGSTGGGVSVIFERPSWQAVHVASLNHDGIDGRVVPDITALAGQPFYDLVLQGAPEANGGTSASTPLWAALLADLRSREAQPGTNVHGTAALPERRKRSTLRQGHLRRYHQGQQRLHPPGVGYDAAPGYDAVSGWGAPNGGSNCSRRSRRSSPASVSAAHARTPAVTRKAEATREPRVERGRAALGRDVDQQDNG